MPSVVETTTRTVFETPHARVISVTRELLNGELEGGYYVEQRIDESFQRVSRFEYPCLDKARKHALSIGTPRAHQD